ncbi:hypothetical protein, partial [Pseudomonas frederiksbergensis]|uniref:hypothetical protein n=1 Tax=Pseudomonas frederiksbergensis TaxID=104087 RepID=UPI001C8389D0
PGRVVGTCHEINFQLMGADSFALYERASDDTTVSLEQGSTGARVCCIAWGLGVACGEGACSRSAAQQTQNLLSRFA